MAAEVEVIGVDHGWSLIKTATQVFSTGVREIAGEPPLKNDIVEYNKRYYEVGGRRLEVRANKIENENFYILTLTAIAKELKRRGKTTAKVFLAVGLPISRFSDEKKPFVEYLKEKEDLVFRFEDEAFHVILVGVQVYPQCYGALVDRISQFNQGVVAVDIGSWTIDIMPIENKRPVNAECISLQNGLIPCMRAINERCYRLHNTEIDESVIRNYMRYGTVDLDDEYLQVMKSEISRYVEGVYNSLREYKINLKTTKIIFVGGGAVVMKNFGKLQQRNIGYALDVKANAKGFEQLGKIAAKKGL